MTIKDIIRNVRQAQFDAAEAEFERDPNPKTLKRFEKVVDEQNTKKENRSDSLANFLANFGKL